MRRIFVPLMVFLMIAGCGQNAGGQNAPDTGEEEPSASTQQDGAAVASQTVAIESGEADVRVQVEVADDRDEMAKGLMGRTALAEDAGMLFVYPEERELSFWMRDTLIPLSIAFMDGEGRIVDIQDMKALDDRPPHYTPAEPARYALEANVGFFDERGVEVGDRARLPV